MQDAHDADGTFIDSSFWRSAHGGEGTEVLGEVVHGVQQAEEDVEQQVEHIQHYLRTGLHATASRRLVTAGMWLSLAFIAALVYVAFTSLSAQNRRWMHSPITLDGREQMHPDLLGFHAMQRFFLGQHTRY